MDWELIGKIFGGIGLFLTGIDRMRSGFQAASGNSLRRILSEYTETTPLAILSGFLVSSAVQSASAVTLTLIGFINARLLHLRQAVMVEFGANLGKISIVWLIAIIGFKLNLASYALPMLSFGIIIKMALRKKFQGFGTAIVGFSLLFFGISVLKDGITQLTANADFSAYQIQGFEDVLICLVIGSIISLIMQSSTGALAVIVSATASGVLNVETASVLMIGLNLGTVSSSIFASINASPNAKRLAASHIVFNLTCTAIGLILTALLFHTQRFMPLLAIMNQNKALSITVFYTVIISLTMASLLPFATRFVLWLKAHFDTSTSLGHPRYLDHHTSPEASSSQAFEALQKEILRFGQISHGMLCEAVSWHFKKGWVYSSDLSHQESELDRLSEYVHSFAANLSKQENGNEESQKKIETLCRAVQHFELVSDLSYTITKFKNRLVEKLDDSTLNQINLWSQEFDQTMGRLESVIKNGNLDDFKAIQAQLYDLDADRRSLRSQLIQESIAGRIKSSQSSTLIDIIETARRALREHMKGIYKSWHDLTMKNFTDRGALLNNPDDVDHIVDEVSVSMKSASVPISPEKVIRLKKMEL